MNPNSSYPAVGYHQAFGKETIGPGTYGNIDQSYDYATADSTRAVYQAAKALADKHIWKLQKENPDVDITIRKGSQPIVFAGHGC